MFQNADKIDACIVIAQADISSGYEILSCRCTVFVSKSYRYTSYEQALGRTVRAKNAEEAKNLYIHLLVEGGVDEDCHDTIMSGVDFSEKLYT